MRRLVVLALALLAVLACGRAAYAANVNCASLALYPFPGSPLTNAALSCDSNGNLVVTDQALYNAAYAQTAVNDSGILLEGWSTLGGGSGIDALVDGPSAGPAGGLGLPLGTPGVLYVQGIGPYGSVPIFSTTGFPITDSTLVNTANVSNGALQVANVGASHFAPGQVTFTATTATLIVAARTGGPGTGRTSVTIENDSSGSSAAVLYIGGSNVTASAGLPVVAGSQPRTINTTAAIYGVLAASGSVAVSYYELY
jgi:hypothetical protein